MNEHEILKQAYFVLGLAPGDSAAAVTARYKKLVQVWHPDRFKSDETRDYAQEEVKKINGARDTLNAHFRSGHKDTGLCHCRAQMAEPGPEKSKDDAPKEKEPAQGQAKQGEPEPPTRETKSKSQATENPAPQERPVVNQSISTDLRRQMAQWLAFAWLALYAIGFVFGHG